MHRLLVPAYVALLALACDRTPSVSAPGKKSAPSEPGRVTLSPEAERRLGIPEGLIKVVSSRAPARRLYPGEVMPAPGHSVLLSAPLAGTVIGATPAGLPAAGTLVRAGQPLLGLAPLPVLSERAQVATIISDTEAQVARARAQEQTAALALARAERLVKDGLAGEKLREEALAQRDSARATRQALESQQSALGASQRPGKPPASTGLLAQTRIDAPFDGFVRDLRVATGQPVSVGTPLIEVVSRSVLWLRVSVAASQINTVAADRDVLVNELSPSPQSSPVTATPVSPAPETIQPGTGTLDLYFLLPESMRFRVGQRVAAWVAQASAQESPPASTVPNVPDRASLAIPASALLYGPGGETWVYERTAPQVFIRRRIEVLRSEGSLLLLRATTPLAPGAEIVTAGAAELQGAEFGVGK